MTLERSPRILPQEAFLLGEKIPTSLLSTKWIETATVDVADRLHQAAIFGGMLARGIKITSDGGKIFLGEPGNPHRQIIVDNSTDSTSEFAAECFVRGVSTKNPRSIKIHGLLSNRYVRISTRNFERPLEDCIQIKFYDNNDTETVIDILDNIWYATFAKRAGNVTHRLCFSSGSPGKEIPLMAVVQKIEEKDLLESPMINLWNKVDAYLLESNPIEKISREELMISGETVIRSISRICNKFGYDDIRTTLDLVSILLKIDSADDFLDLFVDKLTNGYGVIFKNTSDEYRRLAKAKTGQVPQTVGIASAIFTISANKLIPVLPFKFTLSNSEFSKDILTEEEQKIWVNFIGKYVRRNIMSLNQIIKNLDEIVGNNKRALHILLKKGIEFRQIDED